HHRDPHSFPTRRSSDLCIFASLQIGDGSSPAGTYPPAKELLKDGWLALALGDQPGHDLAEGPVERVDQPPHSKAERLFRGQDRRDRKSTRLNSSHDQIS